MKKKVKTLLTKISVGTILSLIGIFLTLFYKEVRIFMGFDREEVFIENTSEKKSKEIITDSINIQTTPLRETKKEVKKTRKEAMGKSGYKLEEQWAFNEAEKKAYENLKKRLNSSDFTYEIDYEKSQTIETDSNGYISTVVIYTYQ